jgi:protein involved in polysaccharide export with SLBB domain
MKLRAPRRPALPFPSLVLVLVLGLCACAAPLRAAEYTLGPEDVVSVSVWLHPELERTAPIGSDGELVFPPVGNI